MANNNEFQVDVRDVEYQSMAGKPWLARIYQPEKLQLDHQRKTATAKTR